MVWKTLVKPLLKHKSLSTKSAERLFRFAHNVALYSSAMRCGCGNAQMWEITPLMPDPIGNSTTAQGSERSLEAGVGCRMKGGYFLRKK